MKKALFIIVPFSVILLSFFIGYLLLDNGIIWLNNPSEEKYPVRGIDISHHQGDIDWQKLKEHKFVFVFMKSTEGHDFNDKKFKENWINASRIGLIKGAYHYYSLRIPGKEQAENFINTVPVEQYTLPPVIDLEFGGNSKLRPKKDVLVEQVKKFIIEIEKHYNQTPIIYTTYDFHSTYLENEFPGNKIWIRDIIRKPHLSRKWHFWQYNCRGRIDAADGFIDLNVFNGTKEEFFKLVKKNDK